MSRRLYIIINISILICFSLMFGALGELLSSGLLHTLPIIGTLFSMLLISFAAFSAAK